MSRNDRSAWDGDLLNRKNEADFLLKFLIARNDERKRQGIDRSYVINLDSKWGQGKTYFLKNIQLQLEKDNFVVAYIDCWKDDHADDPMIAAMAAIDAAVTKHLSKRNKLKKVWGIAKQSGAKLAMAAVSAGAKKFSEKFIGEGLAELAIIASETSRIDVEEIKNNSSDVEKQISDKVDKIIDERAKAALANFTTAKISIENFKDNMARFAAEIGSQKDMKLPVFVLVDELDRCRPPYAISTLEKIKHFFEVRDLIFIVATDTEQLRHSINVVYGPGFDSTKYLLRFFDRSYNFLAPNHSEFIAYLFETKPINIENLKCIYLEHQEIFVKLASSFVLSIRDIEQCYDHLADICSVWDQDVPLQYMYLLPLIVLYQSGRRDDFAQLEQMILSEYMRAVALKVGDVAEYRPDGYAHNEKRNLSYLQVLEGYIEYARQDLEYISDNLRGSSERRAVHGQFDHEYRTRLSQANFINVNIQRSLLNTYGNYIKSVGRLKAKTN